MRFQSPAPSPPPVPRWRTLLGKYWMVPVILALMSIHGVVFALVKLQAGDGLRVPTSRELTLGEYGYRNSQGEGARFRLHVSLLEPCPVGAEALFARRRYKLQQAVEEALREAQPSDFSDPRLLGVKRQFQELIHQTLGMRVVEEVLITDLQPIAAEGAR